ncbi:MAG: hypothetical protein QOH04_762 [Sphingomonadales bacterium]|jgi:hypothetical protein|nr:hypothetical protein [Sphingomonadales bacterium]
MRWTITLACLTLGLAACGSGGSSGNVTQVRAANPMSDQLKTLSPLSRDLGLYRAVRDSGQRCKKAENGAYQQEYKNLALWTVHCTDSGDWALFIAPNGDVQARRCADAAELKLPPCRTAAPVKPEAPAPKAARRTGSGRGSGR